MLAEVTVRRAEEIKHLTEASGFLFQQIQRILLKAEGRKEKHARTMPEKTCLLSIAWEIIQGHCISVERQLKWCQGLGGVEKTLHREFKVRTHTCPLRLYFSPSLQDQSHGPRNRMVIIMGLLWGLASVL